MAQIREKQIQIRGQAMSIAALALWITCFLVTQFYPMLQEKVGNAPIFWMYSGSNIVCIIFVLLFVPETKNRTLEQIEQSWLAQV